MSVCVVPEAGPSTLGSMLMPSQETEWEELIRTGQMTPFGTRIPQKEVKKEPRKVMLAENSAFDQYLADQAKLATERKRGPVLKKKRSSGLSPDEEAMGKSNRMGSSSKDKKIRKRMRKLQITALKAHPKARPKAEPQLPKPRRKFHTEGEEMDSEGSEYLPSDEGIDPDQEEREAMEEGFAEDDEEEYELKPYKKQTEGKGRKKVKKKEEGEEEYCPESSGEEEDEKGKAKKCKDDGDVEYYRQRIRYDFVLAPINLLKLLFFWSPIYRGYGWMQRCEKSFHQQVLTSVLENDMLNKHQTELLTSHHICSGSGANVLLLFPLVKEKAVGFCWLHSAEAELIPDEIGSCFLTKQIHSLLFFSSCSHTGLIILLHMVLYTHSL